VSYTINLSNGTTLVPGGLSDGTVDISHSSLVLIGKNYAGYGQFLNENFVKLLENFANTSSPSNPLKGQLWWDAANNILKVYSGTSWKISTGATSSPFNSPPGDLSALGGDLWFDTTNGQLKVYSGTSWITVGPAATTAAGDTGAFPVIMSDTSSGGHIVIQLRFSGVVYAIFSKDTFSSALTGFGTIKAGLNFSTIASPTWGLNTQDVAATNNTLVQRDSAGGINTTGINATAIQAASMNATSVTANVIIPLGGSFTSNGYSTYNGFELATVGGTASFASINNTPIGNAIPSTASFTSVVVSGSGGLSINAGGVNVTSNLVANIGTTSGYFNQVYGNAFTVLNGVAPTTANASSVGTNAKWFGSAYTNGLTVGNAAVYTSVAPAANLTATLGTSSLWFGSAYTNGLTVGNAAVYTSVAPAANLTASLGTPNLYFNGIYGNVVTVYNSIVPTANLAANIGSPTSWFNNIYGTAMHAQYADLAERFEADAEYEPGTVLELGGDKEVTAVGTDLSENVFGVISTNAAYLMNSKAGSNATHPPVAVQGRVPVKVTGRVRKGDRLVSAGNGIARSGTRSEINTWNVIGRALEHKLDDGVGIIEAVVKLNS
jgi:hypothetical protein